MEEFVPGYIEIKDFNCSWEERREKGIDRPRAERFVNSVKEHLPEPLRPHMKDIRLSGLMNHKIGIDTTPKHSRELRGVVQDIITNQDFKINDVIPRVGLEPSPERKQKNRDFGKFVDCVRKAAVSKEDVEVVVEPRFHAVFLRVDGEERLKFIGEIPKDTTEPKVEEANVTMYLQITKDDLLA